MMALTWQHVPSTAGLMFLALVLLSTTQQQWAPMIPAAGPTLCLATDDGILVPLTTLQSSTEYRSGGGLGSFVNLAALGGPDFGMATKFYKLLQQVCA
jgi:hypothetical protein